jgi:hypothetical protein
VLALLNQSIDAELVDVALAKKLFGSTAVAASLNFIDRMTFEAPNDPIAGEMAALRKWYLTRVLPMRSKFAATP